MTTLEETNTNDKITYTLNLNKSIATFKIDVFDTIGSNLSLIDKFYDILVDECIEYVQFEFIGRGKKKIQVGFKSCIFHR